MKIAVIAIALAGCASVPAPPDPTGPCMISDVIRGRYIGSTFREAVREPLQHDTNSRIARVLRPGDVATMDMRSDRLNIMVDDSGQIEGLRCG